MKILKNLTLSAFALASSVSLISAQTTATDFTANDCNGVSHNLFTELNAGKVIVIAWVMPCGSCAAPSLAAYNAVQSYASTNPNTVFFYLVDDVANTTCASLTTWGNTNAMPDATKFSNAVIDMDDYGTPGMPKIVVLGGLNHSIAYNLNTGVTQIGVQNAIDGLLATMGTNDLIDESHLQPKIVPNPVNGEFTIEYYLESAGDVTLELFTAVGEVVYSAENKTSEAGIHTINFGSELKLAKGAYFVKISNGMNLQTGTFVVE